MSKDPINARLDRWIKHCEQWGIKLERLLVHPEDWYPGVYKGLPLEYLGQRDK